MLKIVCVLCSLIILNQYFFLNDIRLLKNIGTGPSMNLVYFLLYVLNCQNANCLTI